MNIFPFLSSLLVSWGKNKKPTQVIPPGFGELLDVRQAMSVPPILLFHGLEDFSVFP